MRNQEFARKRGYTPSCAGSHTRKVYTPLMQEDGSIRLVESGEQDIDEVIQSYYESTTLEVILAKFANGDLSALNRYQPIYADVTEGPKTLAESLQLFINGEHAFDALPTDIKKQFDNDYKQWILSSQSPEWLEKMSPVLNPASPTPTPAPNPASPTPSPAPNDPAPVPESKD